MYSKDEIALKKKVSNLFLLAKHKETQELASILAKSQGLEEDLDKYIKIWLKRHSKVRNHYRSKWRLTNGYCNHYHDKWYVLSKSDVKKNLFDYHHYRMEILFSLKQSH